MPTCLPAEPACPSCRACADNRACDCNGGCCPIDLSRCAAAVCHAPCELCMPLEAWVAHPVEIHTPCSSVPFSTSCLLPHAPSTAAVMCATAAWDGPPVATMWPGTSRATRAQETKRRWPSSTPAAPCPRRPRRQTRRRPRRLHRRPHPHSRLPRLVRLGAAGFPRGSPCREPKEPAAAGLSSQGTANVSTACIQPSCRPALPLHRSAATIPAAQPRQFGQPDHRGQLALPEPPYELCHRSLAPRRAQSCELRWVCFALVMSFSCQLL